MRLFSFFLFILISTTTTVSAQTVYKARTGKKYHIATCHHVRHGAQAIKLEEARKLKLGACLHCKPDTHIRSATTFPRTALPTPKKSSPPATTSVSVQCRGTTQAGNRCKRKTKNKSGYCYQHG